MCTYATECLHLVGSGKAAGAWSPLDRATVYVDHPYATALEHTLNLDLFGAGGPRLLALELSVESAHALRDAIDRALDAALEGPEVSTAVDSQRNLRRQP
ncbi:MAG: DUF6295 family protein [Candidatus Dormibacteria bacterium]